MDTVSKQKRSEIMSHIKNKDSKMEILFRKELWKTGLRYRKNSGKYFGKPDIVLLKYKTAIFIDSCFWHGCKKHCRIPETRKNYWKSKIERNRQRDKEVNKYYKKSGWKLFRFWEHQIKNSSDKQIKKCEENFFAGWRALASGGGAERQSSQSGFSSKKVRILTKKHRLSFVESGYGG